MSKLEWVSIIEVVLKKAEETEQSIFLDSLRNARLLRLKKLVVREDVLRGMTVQKMLPVMKRPKELNIECRKVEEEDALLQVFAKAVNLESIVFQALSWNVPNFHGIFKKVLCTAQRRPKLKNITSYGLDELREAVQCLRLRRVLIRFGNIKCVAYDWGRYLVPQ